MAKGKQSRIELAPPIITKKVRQNDAPYDLSFENEGESLGEYLQKAPKIDVLEEMHIKRVKPFDSRFAFVTTSWKI